MNNKKNLAALDLFIVHFAHFLQVKDVSKVSNLEKKIRRSLSPEISMLRRSLKVNLFFKSRILRAGSLFFFQNLRAGSLYDCSL